MKKGLLFLASALLTTFSWAGEKENIKSTITEVTVYSQGAQVYRKASFTVKPGITEIIIDGICKTIDGNSLQVKASGNLIILDSKYSLFYPEPSKVDLSKASSKALRDIKLYEDSITRIGYDIQELQDEIDVLNSTKQILLNNGSVRGQGKVNDSIQLLKQTIDYFALKMNDINKQLLKLNRRKIEKTSQKTEWQQRLNDIKNHENSTKPTENKGPIHRITITVSAKEVVSGKISLSYLVSGAGWSPLYDLRTDISSGKVNLNYKAHIFQNTGTDWDDVRLNVSTNNPYQNKTKPELHPWYVDYYVYRQPVYNGNMAPVQLDEIAVTSTREKDKNRLEGVSYDAKTAADFSQLIDHVISAEFKIDLPYSIKSNNEKHMVLISNTDLNATFKYYTAPKMDASVYLVALISKLDELQLIPAKANIFFDGTYIGETYLDPSNMNDTLSLSLGRDPNILVKKTLLKKDNKEKIIGTYIEKTLAYNIEIKNLKSTNVTVVVQDQIPITQNTDITIELENSSKAKVNSKTGLMEWEITLKPKEAKNLDYRYKVKYNKDKQINF